MEGGLMALGSDWQSHALEVNSSEKVLWACLRELILLHSVILCHFKIAVALFWSCFMVYSWNNFHLIYNTPLPTRKWSSAKKANSKRASLFHWWGIMKVNRVLIGIIDALFWSCFMVYSWNNFHLIYNTPLPTRKWSSAKKANSKRASLFHWWGIMKVNRVLIGIIDAGNFHWRSTQCEDSIIYSLGLVVYRELPLDGPDIWHWLTIHTRQLPSTQGKCQ